MRLINCRTVTLESFEHSEAPPYGILSHTWAEDEVTFLDFLLPDTRETRQGWRKIELTCRQALADNLDYAWVDCCCINRDSSSELSESINSMFRWYTHSAHCYVFLSDYQQEPTPLAPADITASNWFNRGWTLQELIAPLRLSFYDAKWKFIGTKGDLSAQISRKTKIDEHILTATSAEDIRSGLDECTVAMRMSWAAPRKTRRPEDMAYSLLGIFDISMPMLYGEGERAFTRLQEEIIKDSNDTSIFAWQTSTTMGPTLPYKEMYDDKSYRGIFAQRPSEFAFGHQILQTAVQTINPEFTLTNKGLKIWVNLIKMGRSLVFMPLNYLYPCQDPANAQKVGLCLRRQGDGVYARAYPQRLLVGPSLKQISDNRRMQIFVSKHLKASMLRTLAEIHRLEFQIAFHEAAVIKVTGTWPSNQWDPVNGVFAIPSENANFVGYQQIHFKDENGAFEDEFLLICGYEPSDGAWVCLNTSATNNPLYYAAKSFNMAMTAALGKKDQRLKLKVSATTVWRVQLEEVVEPYGEMKFTRFRLVMHEEWA